jgi:hypothetical protein
MSEHQWEDHHPANDTFAPSSKLPHSIRDQIVNGPIVMLFGTPFAILASLMHDRAPSPACRPCFGYDPLAIERRRRQHRSWLFSTLPRAFTKGIFALPAASSFLSSRPAGGGAPSAVDASYCGQHFCQCAVVKNFAVRGSRSFVLCRNNFHGGRASCFWSCWSRRHSCLSCWSAIIPYQSRWSIPRNL